ncbi:hypothetical protein ABN763_13070 [Spongiivirga sp. MCCC 1A20706]|uniref:hypothetical protein n=1 Tax=Spongiivirga sp. MCCC 1A20706 TaxID=3160963 RepID=UPI00397732AE
MIFFLTVLSLFTCQEDDATALEIDDSVFTIAQYDGTLNAPFGDLPYRVFYPTAFDDQTFVIILSRGGNGQGDDRGALLSYANKFVLEGYVVVQIDHRNAGSNIENIAQLRGEEIQFLSDQIAKGTIDYGNFLGSIDGTKQGYIGHSAGAMEGLLSAGMDMNHGNYLCPAIKAVYAMSPPGYSPDQFGIKQSPNGFSTINQTAVLMIIGEAEKDSNGMETINQEDWRLQGYEQMNEDGLRIQILVEGDNTGHNDIAGLNRDIKTFNEENSIVLFDTYLKGLNSAMEIGNIALPSNNNLVFKKKGE